MSIAKTFGFLALLLGGTLMGSAARATEEPPHTVVYSAGSIEIRDYAPMILAEVQVVGDMVGAGNRGFRPLAGYIFGNNRGVERDASATIAMTTPVIQERSQNIAMTTPVTQAQSEDGSWRVAFVMPQAWRLETLPTPNDPNVELRSIEARRMAVIRFTGSASDARFEQKAAELTAFLSERGLELTGSPIFARYNPPWVPAPFRRNEVMIEIRADQGGF
jgi:effector-binding domain-containing protein